MKLRLVLPILSAALLVAACQSAPPKVVPPAAPTPAPAEVAAPEPPVPVPEVPAAPIAPDSIEANRDGFSPKAAFPNDTLTFNIRWGAPSSVVEWAVLIIPEGGAAVRTLRGTTTVPTQAWDGKTDSGTYGPQGKYRAVLQTASANGVLVERASTAPFFLDIVPPSGTITVKPLPFQPGPPEAIVTPSASLTIQIAIIDGGAPWTTWRLAVFHPDGRRFRDFISEEHRDDTIVWNGRAINNAQLEVGTTYRLEAEVFDIYGNKGILTTELPVASPPKPDPIPAVSVAPATPSPVVVSVDGKLLAELKVFFAPYSASLTAVSVAQKASNDVAIAKLADLLKGVPGTAVRVIGHANQVLYQDPIKAAYEQAQTLLPLSRARAEAVRKALVDLGIDGETLKAEGVGAAQPLAPFADAANRWKNRRVAVELWHQDE